MDNFKIVKMESEQHFAKRYDDLIKSYLTFGEWADDAKGKFYEIRNILTELQFSQYQINNFRFKYFANESKSLEIVQAFEIDRIVNGLEYIARMFDQFFFDTIFDLEHEGIPYNEDIITENIAIEVRKIFHEELKDENLQEIPKETALEFNGKIVTALRCIYLNMDAYLYGCKVHYDYKILDHNDSHLFTIPELFNEIHDNIFCVMECYENVLSILYNYGYNEYIDEHVEAWNNPKDEDSQSDEKENVEVSQKADEEDTQKEKIEVIDRSEQVKKVQMEIGPEEPESDSNNDIVKFLASEKPARVLICNESNRILQQFYADIDCANSSFERVQDLLDSENLSDEQKFKAEKYSKAVEMNLDSIELNLTDMEISNYNESLLYNIVKDFDKVFEMIAKLYRLINIDAKVINNTASIDAILGFNK